MPPPTDTPASPSFRRLLWRYFSFGWLLELPPGDVWQDRSVRAKNRGRLSRYLPTYIRRHLVLVAASMATTGTLQARSGVALMMAIWFGLEVVLVLAMAGLWVCLQLPLDD